MTRGKCGLDRGDCKRTALGNGQRHRARLVHQLVVGHHFVDEPDLQRFARRQLGVGEPHFLGLLLADQVFEVPGAVAGVETAHHRADLTEHRAFLGDGDVAHHLQHLPAADGITVDHGYHRFLQALDGFVNFQRRQHASIERGVLKAILAPADAEKFIPRAGDHDHACACFAADVVDAVTNLVAHLGGEHIAIVGAIERQPADGTFFFISNCIKRHFLNHFLSFQL